MSVMRKGSDVSVLSGTQSTVSKTSKSSLASRAASATKAIKKGFTLVTGGGQRSYDFGPRSTTASVAALVELDAGCHCETISLVTMRKEEALDSPLVSELPVGTALEVLELGLGRRLKVKAGSIEGWVSSKTRLNEPLILRRRADMDMVIEDFEVGGQHEVKSLVTVRADEGLDSSICSELKPGTLIRIVALGTTNKRRAKIVAPHVEGWISLATKTGDLLVGKVSDDEQRRFGLFGAGSAKAQALLEAARKGDLPALRKIVEGNTGMLSKFTSRPNLNCSDIRGKTALIYAASFSNKDVVDYLLRRTGELQVNATDDTLKTALHHASKRARTRRSPEYDEVQSDIITSLLQAGIYMEARDHNGCTALMFAVANGDEAVARRLITAKANVNVKDFEGHSCMDYAKRFNRDGVAQLLLGAGAEVLPSEDEAPEGPGFSEEPTGGVSEDDFARPGEAAVAAAVTRLSDLQEVPAAAQEAATSPPVEAEEALEAQPQPGPVAVLAPEQPGLPRASEAAKEPDPEQTGKKVKKKKEHRESAAGSAKGGKASSGDPEKKKKQKSVEKGEKGRKGKGEPKRRVSSTGMLEAVEAEEAATAVIVEADHTEEIDEKRRALDKLAALLGTTTSPGEIEAAIKVAQANGAVESDLEQAQQALKALKARQRARDRLRDAIEHREVQELRDAVAGAEACQVPSSELEEAKKVLNEEEPKQQARDQLKAAKLSGGAAELKTAVATAKSVGLPATELAEFEELLASSESKEKAETALRAAIKDRSVATLKFAIRQASDCGVDIGLVLEAEAMLRDEEPKQNARDLLAKACESPSKTELNEAIDAAKAAGLSSSDYGAAQELLRQEEEKEKLLEEVNATLSEVAQVENEIEALRVAKEKLSDAIDQAIQGGVAEADLATADTRRKKLHNAVEDLKGSIRVYCRVRPLSKKETEQGDENITKAINSMTIEVESQQFQFDSVWTPGTQEEVFEDCRDLVQSAVDGYNVTMFAYGQTGAGKTFTMYGAPGLEGTAPRTIKEIFRVTDRGKDRFNYTIMGSMLELYRNDLVDLLSKGDPKASHKKLNVRQEKTGSVVVEHLTEEECADAESLSELLERGNKQRTVAATAMNSESSRSHLVLIIRIVSVNKETKEQLKGKILICDLAGSERLKKSQVEAHMQKEAIEINKSLTALGDVIEALTKSAKVVPYRNHKLTQLMQDSLGGTAKTLMFVNCSPASSNLDETLMSLKYATRAKKITNQAAKKG